MLGAGVEVDYSDDAAITPQWRVMERVTAGGVLATIGDHTEATKVLSIAVVEAEERWLPHQLQRILRIADSISLPTGTPIEHVGNAALRRLHDASRRLDVTELLSTVGTSKRAFTSTS
jgi:hypothetical protein